MSEFDEASGQSPVWCTPCVLKYLQNQGLCLTILDFGLKKKNKPKQKKNRHLGVSYMCKLLWLSELPCVAEPGWQICCVLPTHHKYKCFHLKLSNRVLRQYIYIGFTTGKTKRNLNWPAIMIQCHMASLCAVGTMRTCMYFPHVYVHETPLMPKVKCVYYSGSRCQLYSGFPDILTLLILKNKNSSHHLCLFCFIFF